MRHAVQRGGIPPRPGHVEGGRGAVQETLRTVIRRSLQTADVRVGADAVDAVTIQDKIRLEQTKTAIEVQALKERTKIEMEQIDAQTERQVDEARKAAMAQGIFYDPYLKELDVKIRELSQHEKDALQ